MITFCYGYVLTLTTGGQTVKYPAETLTPDEINALISKCSNRAPTGCRNRALLATLYRAGLRISEALGLFPRDLDAQHGTLRVRHGKGDKCRMVAMDTIAWGLLQRWLDKREALGFSGK